METNVQTCFLPVWYFHKACKNNFLKYVNGPNFFMWRNTNIGNGNVMSLYHLYSPANSVANFLHFGSRVHPETNTMLRQVYLHFPHKTKWNRKMLRDFTSCVLCVSVSKSRVCLCMCACTCMQGGSSAVSKCMQLLVSVQFLSV